MVYGLHTRLPWFNGVYTIENEIEKGNNKTVAVKQLKKAKHKFTFNRALL